MNTKNTTRRAATRRDSIAGIQRVIDGCYPVGNHTADVICFNRIIVDLAAEGYSAASIYDRNLVSERAQALAGNSYTRVRKSA